MWNDEEDNNPYGTSFDRRDSQTSSSANPTSPTPRDCEYPSCSFICGRDQLPTIMDSICPDDDDDLTNTAESIDRSFETPHTPTSVSDDDPQHATFSHAVGEEDSDSEVVSRGEAGPKRKPGGYNSRIEQILYENPDLPIVISDAGKSLESGGRYIVYTIRTGVR